MPTKKMTKKMTKSELKQLAAKHAVTVDRTFLRELANKIYNSKNRTYLRLCKGTLQNGPDPKDASRPMHCGLGELYFQMTGYEPKETGVDEDDVVALAVAKSTVKMEFDEKVETVQKTIENLELPNSLEEAKDHLLNELKEATRWNENEVDDNHCGEMAEYLVEFRSILYNIPNENDEGPSDEYCDVTDYKERSVRVAKAFREAAKLLPW